MNSIYKYIAIVLLMCVTTSSFAQIFDSEKPNRLVNDYANILTNEQEGEIESTLMDLNTKSSTQIVVVTTNSLEGMDIAQFATELGHKWGVGQKGKDNGIMFVIKPSSATEKGKVYIATGYGLEGVVPDATAHLIINNEVIPFFKKGKIYEGIYSGVTILKGLVANEYTAEEYTKERSSSNANYFFIALIILIIFSKAFSNKGANSNTIGKDGSRMSGGGFYPPIFMGGGRSSGGFSSFSGGSSFGGFGGGGFGGGGAGGEW